MRVSILISFLLVSLCGCISSLPTKRGGGGVPGGDMGPRGAGSGSNNSGNAASNGNNGFGANNNPLINIGNGGTNGALAGQFPNVGGPANFIAGLQNFSNGLPAQPQASAPNHRSANNGNQNIRDGAQAKSSPSQYKPVDVSNNPAWLMDIFDGEGRKKVSGCQASLAATPKNGKCFAILASHCFESALAYAGMKMAENACEGERISSEGQRISVPIQFNGPGMSMIKATAHVNKDYFERGRGDTAVVEWDCSTPPPVRALNIASSPPKHGEQVWYGKIMGGKQGLWPGTVQLYRDITVNGSHARRQVEDGTYEVIQQGPATEHGDSGGPLINASMEIVGNLSGAAFYEEGPTPLYAAGRGPLDFIRKTIEARSTGRQIAAK